MRPKAYTNLMDKSVSSITRVCPLSPVGGAFVVIFPDGGGAEGTGEDEGGGVVEGAGVDEGGGDEDIMSCSSCRLFLGSCCRRLGLNLWPEYDI